MFVVIVFLILAFLFFILYSKYHYLYWLRKGIPQIKPSLPFGNGKKLYTGQLTMSSAFLEFYNEFKRRDKDYGGIYFLFEPFLIPVSVEMIKNILIKDFQYWTDHGVYHHEKDFLTENMFTIHATKWKNCRVSLTPAFTATKLKGLFEVISKKISQLENILQEDHALQGKPLDIKQICHCLSTDVSSCCGFGVDFNSLENADCQFRYYSVEVVNNNKLRPFLEMVIPWNILGYFSYKCHLGKELEEYYRKFLNIALQHHEGTGLAKNNYLDLLRKMKSKNIIDENQMVAECLLYMLASAHTTAASASNCLWELAKNPDLQEKLLVDIQSVAEKYDGKITYEGLLEMNYLKKVVKETLRLHTIFPVIFRSCTRNYQLPGTNILLKKGTRVAIPIIGIHMDPDFYPNPKVFNPENFSPENVSKRPDMSWLPFGDGPRKCLGYRLGFLQVKSVVASLVRKFKFTINTSSSSGELILAKYKIINHVEGSLWLDVRLRENSSN